MREYPFYIDVLGGVAGFLTTTAFLPQVIKVIKTKSTHDLSMGMFIVFCIGVFLWLIFGICLNSGPIIIANFFTLIFSLIILWYKIKYG
jgi:MtN3 and saliva related transmembrane protein